MAKKQRTREEIKKELIDKCLSEGVGKKGFKFISRNMNEMLRPKCHLVIDNHIFKLRYVRDLESPFEEDQPADVPVTLERICIDDYELETSVTDVALNMFLMLSPSNEANGGRRYRLENKEKEAQEVLNNYELLDSAAERIRNSNIEECKAALHVLTGENTVDYPVSSVKLELRQYADRNANAVINAFNDETTLIRYKYYVAKRLGYLIINDDETMVKWRDNNKVILTVQQGKILSFEFAKFCLSEEGKQFLIALDDKLLN